MIVHLHNWKESTGTIKINEDSKVPGEHTQNSALTWLCWDQLAVKFLCPLGSYIPAPRLLCKEEQSL